MVPIVVGRKHLNRNVASAGILLQMVQYRPTQHVRQEYIQRNGRWAELPGQPHRGEPVARATDVPALVAQRHGEQLGQGGLVVDHQHPYRAPVGATQLAGIPPTIMHTAEFDPLRDEGAAFADRLREAGVKTTYRCHSGMIHLFYGMGALIPYAATAYQQMGTDIRSMLGGNEA